MTIRTVHRLVLVASFAFAFAAAVEADIIVQEGGLEGEAGPPTEHPITLDQFDTMGGTRVLNFVRLDFFTTLFAEAVTNGGGGTVDVFASLSADYYFLDETPIAETATAIGESIDNTGPPVAILYLDEDVATVTYDLPADLDPWIGTGTIDLVGIAQLIVTADPPDVIEFSAGGSVTYVVTYDYDEVAPCPADVDGDGWVGVNDLTAVILAWGTADPAADVDADGLVEVGDLTAVVLAWGPCG